MNLPFTFSIHIMAIIIIGILIDKDKIVEIELIEILEILCYKVNNFRTKYQCDFYKRCHLTVHNQMIPDIMDFSRIRNISFQEIYFNDSKRTSCFG